MTSPAVLLHQEQGIASISLNRAERGNALSGELVDALLAAVTQACTHPDVHTLVLGGEGRNFCTGFDLSDLDTQSDGDLLLRFVRVEALLDAVWRAPVRTVSVARGRAWGAGADLFAACDLRLATPESSFRFPGAGFGLVLGTRRLAERVSAPLAREWVTQGSTVNAERAVDTGLASRVIEAPANDLASVEWLRQVCGEPPAIDRQTLTAIRQAGRTGGGPGGDALADTDLAALVRSAASPGLKQRIAAYRERGRAAAGKPPA